MLTVLNQIASPGSERAVTMTEMSDVTTSETASSSVRPVSDPLPQQGALQPHQQTVVVVEQPPTPPTSLPISDSQSAGRVRSADRLSPRQPPATVTSDSLPPVAEEDVIVADDNATGPVTEADEVFSATTDVREEELEMKSHAGLS